MDSHTLLTLRANLVFGGIAFIQRNPSFFIDSGTELVKHYDFFISLAIKQKPSGSRPARSVLNMGVFISLRFLRLILHYTENSQLCDHSPFLPPA